MATDIKKYPFKPGLPLDIEIIPIAETFRRLKPILVIPHRTAFYHIFWFTEGTAVHTVDFQQIPIQPNSLLFVNKERVNMFDEAGGYDGKVLIFTDAFFSKSEADAAFLRSTILFNDLLTTPTVDLSQTTTNFLHLLGQIETELQQPSDSFQHDILQNLLHTFLLYADRERRRQGFTEIRKGPDLNYLLLFKDLLETQFKVLKSVGGYARQMSISERRLYQATMNTLDKPPKELIDERVLLEAKRLLVHTSQTIKEIGFALGFEEPTNFIKYFRKHIGQTPVEFRAHYFH